MKSFAQRFPTYEVYRQVVADALVKELGEHTRRFFETRHAFEWAFAAEQEPESLVEKYRKEYAR